VNARTKPFSGMLPFRIALQIFRAVGVKIPAHLSLLRQRRAYYRHFLNIRNSTSVISRLLFVEPLRDDKVVIRIGVDAVRFEVALVVAVEIGVLGSSR
jgi:hypothetical protein